MTVESTGSPEVAARIRHVSKAFAGNRALDDVELEIYAGEVHALVGGNGSGKSTLIKILAGVQPADAGTLEVDGRTFDLRSATPAQGRESGLRFVHQDPSTFAELTVAENLALGHGFETSPLTGIRERAMRRRTREVLARFGLDVDPGAELRLLRPAEQRMVAIARALQDQEGARSGVLVLDEPTAALPPAEVEILLSALRRYADEGQAIMFVSHRLDEVLAVADRVTALRDGRNAGSLDRQQKAHDPLVELIVGRPVEALAPTRRAAVEGRPLLEVRGLTGGRVADVSFEVMPGEVLGLAGIAGSGCSTLLRLLFGAQRRDGGEVELDGEALSPARPTDAMDAGVALVPADRGSQGIFAGHSVAHNMTIASLAEYWRGGMLRTARERADVQRDSERFRVVAASTSLPISQLSGGNQQKVMMARWLRRRPRLLLLDEPTQGVDVGARADLWSIVGDATSEGTAVIVTSSDIEELAAICDRVLIFQNGAVTHEAHGAPLSADRIVQLMHVAAA